MSAFKGIGKPIDLTPKRRELLKYWYEHGGLDSNDFTTPERMFNGRTTGGIMEPLNQARFIKKWHTSMQVGGETFYMLNIEWTESGRAYVRSLFEGK